MSRYDTSLSGVSSTEALENAINAALAEVSTDMGEVEGSISTETAARAAADADMNARISGELAAQTATLDGMSLGLRFAGNWSPASAAFPSSARAGDVYLVTANGTVDGQSFVAGDRIVALKPLASTSTFAANWLLGKRSAVVPSGTVYVSDYGTLTTDSDDAAANTAIIQSAINAAAAAGGGVVVCDFPGTAYVAASQEAGTIYAVTASPGPEVAKDPGDVMCILLKDNVTLRLSNGCVLRSNDQTLAALGWIDGENITIEGDGRSGIRGAGWNSGGAPGIIAQVSAYSDADGATGKTQRNITIRGLDISEFGGYGIQLNSGNLDGVTIEDCYIHDTGADGIDSKARLGDYPQTKSQGLRIVGNRIKDVARRLGGGAVDVRDTQAVVAHNTVYISAGLEQQMDGIRVQGSFYGSGNVQDYTNRGAFLTQIFGNQVYAEDRTEASRGIFAAAAGQVSIFGNGVARCGGGGIVLGTQSSGGREDVGHVQVFGNQLYACKAAGIDLGQANSHAAHNSVIGYHETFNQENGRLAAGQTVFNTIEAFTSADVQVWKNGVQLELTTDYVVTDTETITLEDAVLVTDEIVIADADTVAFDFGAGDCSVTDNDAAFYKALYGSLGSFPDNRVFGNTGEEPSASQRASNDGVSVQFDPVGTAANLGWRFNIKGDGAFAVYNSAGKRAFNVNGDPTHVDFPNVTGSADGSVQFGASGDSTNIQTRIAGKGTAGVRISGPFQLSPHAGASATVPSLQWGTSAGPSDQDGLTYITGEGLYVIENNATAALIPVGATLATDRSLVSRESGDNRYLRQSAGWSGTFTNGDGDTVTVVNGQITGVA